MAINTSAEGTRNNKKQNEVMANQWTQEAKLSIPDSIQDCDYDTAISAAGHGRYNNLLLLAAVCPIVSSLISTSTISFVLPSAECDLMLTNFHKGLLNAVTYVGMIATSFFWGFMSDTLGRQKLLVVGYGLDAIFNFIAGFAQNYTVLFLAKLADGLIVAGPYAVMITYLAECNPSQYRASVVQWSGLLTALGTVLLPLLGWAILPLDISFTIESLSLTFTSWRVFILLSTIPSAVGAITFFFRWESPKFLLMKGHPEEALDILRQMYVVNTGNSSESYPVKSLRVEASPVVSSTVDQKSSLRAVVAGLKQFRPLFKAPYLGWAALVFLFQFGALLGYNTIRLWMPQLFASIMEAENSGSVSNATTVCDLLGTSSSLPAASNDSVEELLELLECTQSPVDVNVYLNSIIIGLVTAVGFLGAGYLTRFIGDIPIILISTAGAVGSCIGMYWAISSLLMLVFSSIFVTSTSISSTAIISVTLQLFPTEIRTMAVILVMMFGQIGGLAGNVIFPLLLYWNCSVLFFLLAGLLFATGIIVLLLPKEKKS